MPANNIEIVTRFEHAFRAGDTATIAELCDPGLIDHNPAPGHEPTLAGFTQKVAGWTQFDAIAMMQQLGAFPA